MKKNNYEISYYFRELPECIYYGTVTSKHDKSAIRLLRKKVGKGVKIIDIVQL